MYFLLRTVEKHLKTFCHRERKKMPDMLNWFGWCTSENVKQGLQRWNSCFVVIIDDGWQSVSMDPNGIEWKADCAAI
ncbi:unnamed protein product [Trifolium pratense]|uniref:Uncharacterized protein n=1 Tax=Trifolium pratense TaxID=57577 RepID=A0ACB0IPS9_TRIPR|nr:unnamed protein product [Trifolium pratense]